MFSWWAPPNPDPSQGGESGGQDEQQADGAPEKVRSGFHPISLPPSPTETSINTTQAPIEARTAPRNAATPSQATGGLDLKRMRINRRRTTAGESRALALSERNIVGRGRDAPEARCEDVVGTRFGSLDHMEAPLQMTSSQVPSGQPSSAFAFLPTSANDTSSNHSNDNADIAKAAVYSRTDITADKRSALKRRLESFYAKHCVHKLPISEEALTRYSSIEEEELFLTLIREYGPEPDTQDEGVPQQQSTGNIELRTEQAHSESSTGAGDGTHVPAAAGSGSVFRFVNGSGSAQPPTTASRVDKHTAGRRLTGAPPSVDSLTEDPLPNRHVSDKGVADELPNVHTNGARAVETSPTQHIEQVTASSVTSKSRAEEPQSGSVPCTLQLEDENRTPSRALATQDDEERRALDDAAATSRNAVVDLLESITSALRVQDNHKKKLDQLENQLQDHVRHEQYKDAQRVSALSIEVAEQASREEGHAAELVKQLVLVTKGLERNTNNVSNAVRLRRERMEYASHAEVDSLSAAISTIDSRLKKMEETQAHTIETLSKEQDECTAQRSALEARMVMAKKRMTAECEEKQLEMENVSSSLDTTDAEIEELERRVAQLRRKRAEQETQLTALADTLATLKSEHDAELVVIKKATEEVDVRALALEQKVVKEKEELLHVAAQATEEKEALERQLRHAKATSVDVTQEEVCAEWVAKEVVPWASKCIDGLVHLLEHRLPTNRGSGKGGRGAVEAAVSEVARELESVEATVLGLHTQERRCTETLTEIRDRIPVLEAKKRDAAANRSFEVAIAVAEELQALLKSADEKEKQLAEFTTALDEATGRAVSLRTALESEKQNMRAAETQRLATFKSDLLEVQQLLEAELVKDGNSETSAPPFSADIQRWREQLRAAAGELSALLDADQSTSRVRE